MKISRLFSIILTLGMILSFFSPSAGAVNAAPAAQTADLPVLQITKTADAAAVNAGSPIGFMITVRNTGLGAASNARLIDLLPPGTTWRFDNPDCFITAEGWLVCQFGDLPAGGVETVHLTGVSTQAMCGTVTNRAAVEANNHRKVVSGTAAVTVNCLTPGLIVSKTPDAAQVTAGGQIGFTLAVLNNGTGVAENVVLTDPLYPEISWALNNNACTIDEANLLTCNFGSLPPGGSASVHVTAASTAAMCGLLENTVSASASNLSGVVTATAAINILCVPDLRLQKTAAASLVNLGDTIRFNLLVESIGAGTVENAALQDQLPSAAGLSWVVESVTGGGTCSIAGSLLSCSFGNMPPGQTRTVVVASPTTSASCGLIENTATVTASNEGEAETGNNSDSASITVNCMNLAIVKTADRAQVEAGDPIGFTITVANGGPAAATNVTVQDQLSTLTTWSENSAACTISAGGLLTCNFGDLAAGASASVHVTAVSSPAMCGLLENTAAAAADNLPGEIFDTAAVDILCHPLITVRKIPEDADIPAGETARFNITVTNQGDAPAENVIITDPLPVVPGVNWSFDNIVGGGTCEISAGVLSCNFGTLDPGEIASVRISSATTAESCGFIVNTVTATATNDPNDAFDIAQIVVTCGADVTIIKTAERSPIRAGDPAQPARFTITVINHGTQTATDVTLQDNLPAGNGLVWAIDSVTGGGTCSLAGGQVLCSFGSLAPGETRTLVISSPTSTATFCQPAADRTIRNFAFVEASNETSPANFDNSAYAEILVECTLTEGECPPITYFNDFDADTTGPEGWTNYKTTISPNKTQEFLGPYTNEDVTFTFAPAIPEGCVYTMVRIQFDLYVNLSWDGNLVRVKPNLPLIGPDHWRFGLQNLDGSPSPWIVDTTFTNYTEAIRSFFKQAYPAAYPNGAYPAKTGAIASNTLGYQFGGPRDSTYRMTYLIPYDDPIVKLLWQGENLQPVEDEHWGIDNLTVELLQFLEFGQPVKYWLPQIFSPGANFYTGPERKTP